ncbi:glycosyltransferase [Maridesulfovibrio ferrireducens]|uniref:glycosyltransferase n=1 Tax=Maridesulfovibrio ferrireducens TaxID=246191 RepID=UPI001A261185|nr:glycosyltransferase [Maridesulfovibrio ferrireducens]MBI9112758.1 glycosyltransferase [Maridesulfovibrio ferrireducens]
MNLINNKQILAANAMSRSVPNGDVCIAITAFNRSKHTLRTIESIWKHAGCDFTLCVVDNASTDDTWELLCRLREKGLVHYAYRFTRNMGPAVAVNHIWSQFTAPFYLRLDNDIFFSKDGWLQTMREKARKHKDISILSYPIFSTKEHYAKVPTMYGNDLLDRSDRKGSHPGGLFFMDGLSFKNIGMWNEDYGSYGAEDGDYSLRTDLQNRKRLYVNDFEWGTHDDFSAEDNKAYVKSKLERQHSHKRYAGQFQINTMMYHYKLRSLRVPRKYIATTNNDNISFSLDREYSSKITHVQSDIRKTLRLASKSGIEIDRINKSILIKLVKASNPDSVIDKLDGNY